MTFMMIIFACVIAGITSYYADQRGRNPGIWFLLGALFGILGLLFLFLLPSYKKAEEETPIVQPPIAEIQNESPHQEYLDKVWYYLDLKHHQQGPLTLAALRLAWHRKTISAESWVWCEGMPEWKLVHELPHFLDALNS